MKKDNNTKQVSELSEQELQQKIAEEKQKRADLAAKEIETILKKYNCQLASRGIFENDGYMLQPYIKAN